MLTWAELAPARPELAEAGRRLLYQFGVGLGFVATVRDGRYALHSFPSEANEDAFYLSGRAMLVDDPQRRQTATAQFLAERKLTTVPEDFDAQELFEFDLERCLWTATSGHGDWHPRHTIWRSS